MASTSRYPSGVHKALQGIKQATEAIQNLESQRSKLIAASLADLKYTRNELDTTVEAEEHQGDFPSVLREQIKDILEAMSALERATEAKQDKLESLEKKKEN